jgi:hypothetical protein
VLPLLAVPGLGEALIVGAVVVGAGVIVYNMADNASSGGGGDSSKDAGNSTQAAQPGAVPQPPPAPGSTTAGQLGDLKPLHGLDPDKMAKLRALSNDELMEAINSPADGGVVQVKPNGTIMNGNHRLAELNRRIRDGSISKDVPVQLRQYDPKLPSSGFWE